LVAIISDHLSRRDFDLFRHHFASLVLVVTREPLGRDPHVDYHLPSPPFLL
jgi:hypothetical protein